MRRPSRRSVLGCAATVALVPLAGCDIPIGPDEETDVFLNNQTESELTVALVVERRDDGESLVDETVTIAGGDSEGFTDVADGEPVTVRVAVEDGPEETYEWTETGSDRALSIGIEADSIGFAVATRG